MKVILVLSFLICSGLSFSQEWRDSLEIARSEYKKKNYKKALSYYKAAEEKAPENIDLSDEIGQTTYKSGDYEAAEKIFEQSEGNNASKKSRAANNHNIGNSRMRKEDFEGAVDAYKESLRMNPRDEKTRYNLSEATRKLKKKQAKEQKQNSGSGQEKESDDNGEPKPGEGDGDDKEEDENGDKRKPGDKTEPKSGDQKKNGKPKKSNKSKLTDTTVEKMLNELLKKEAETKRRLGGGSEPGIRPKNGKDW